MNDRIFEIGGAGLESTDQRVRKLMDNVVNSEVPGYQKSEAIITGFPLELDRATQKITSVKPQADGTFYSNIQGGLVKTNGKLDLALASEGYFVIAGPWGEGYTRDGRFKLDKDGKVLSVAGNYPVLGKSGPLVVPPGGDVEFSQSGELKVDGTPVDSIRVVQPEKQGMFTSLNGSIFKKSDSYSAVREVNSPRVIQGYVETSNVNVVDQMMEMIVMERTYGLDTKVIQTRDSNLAKALTMSQPAQ
jgi:flagellar basal body rod protein FlgG